MSYALVGAFGVLADLQADQAPRHTGPDFGKASPMGLLVIVLLLLATVFLIRSMNRQLKKVPESFDPEHPEPDQAADEGTLPGGSPPGLRGDRKLGEAECSGSPPGLRGDRKLGEAECSGSPPGLRGDQPADRKGPAREPDG